MFDEAGQQQYAEEQIALKIPPPIESGCRAGFRANLNRERGEAHPRRPFVGYRFENNSVLIMERERGQPDPLPERLSA